MDFELEALKISITEEEHMSHWRKTILEIDGSVFDLLSYDEICEESKRTFMRSETGFATL